MPPTCVRCAIPPFLFATGLYIYVCVHPDNQPIGVVYNYTNVEWESWCDGANSVRGFCSSPYRMKHHTAISHAIRKPTVR